MTPEELKRKKEEARLEALALNDKAKAENRSMTAEEQKSFEGLITSMKKLDTEIANAYEVEKLKAVSAPESGKQVIKGDNMTVKLAAEDQPWESFGQNLLAIRNACVPGGSVDPRLMRGAASGSNEKIGSNGGFLVDTDFTKTLLQKQTEASNLFSKINLIPIGPTANGVKIKTIAESSRATGSRKGGVRAYWTNEAGLVDPSKMKFGEIKCDLEKLTAVTYATEEMMEDVVMLEALNSQAYGEEMGWMIDDAIINGTGVGKPKGILTSGAVIEVAKENSQSAATILHKNVLKMWTRLHAPSRKNAIWLINQDCEAELLDMVKAIGTAGVESPFAKEYSEKGTIKNRPVITIEQAQTLGTAGDIMLIDPTQYLGITKGGLKGNSSIHVKFLEGEMAFRWTYRFNGQPWWDAPLNPAKGSTTVSPFVMLATRA